MFSSLKIVACIVVIIGGFYELLIGKSTKSNHYNSLIQIPEAT
jgi:hypothetical protein